MTRVLPRTNFHSSKLIRCLTDLALVDGAGSGNAFAEKLGLWVHFTDAITLSAVHNDRNAGLIDRHPEAQSEAQSEAQTGEQAVSHTEVGFEFDRIRTAVIESITKSFSPGQGKSHIELPTPDLALPINLAAAYAPYRWFHDAHRRDMEFRIQPLRVNVRAALATASPRLRKLADLDAVFEKVMRDRESTLLSRVPVLLERRFEQLFKAHQQMLADTQQVDNPAGWMQAGAWLGDFCNTMQTLLLAEAELRLQPTVGLIEALTNKNRNE